MGLAVALIVIVVLIATVLTRFLRFRDRRIAGEALIAAHRGSTVLRTQLLEFDGVSRGDRARVIAVLVNRDGLSFRDRADAEVTRVSASSVLSIELTPVAGSSPIRPAVLTRADGAPVRFMVGLTPDQQAQSVLAIRSALRG